MNTRKRACTFHHQQGVNAAFDKKQSQASCPYTDEAERSLWYQGYDLASRAISRAGSYLKGKKEIQDVPEE